MAVNILDSLASLIKEKPAMSTKFEQLLDYLVNEEMDKANELFHEIVVEKSREIYENMIAEEAEEDEEQEESVEEASEDDEEQEESVEEGDDSLEEMFGSDEGGDDETSMTIGGDEPADDGSADAADDLEQDTAAPEGDVSAGEEQIIDILTQLKQEFQDIVNKNDSGASDEPADDTAAEPSFGGDDSAPADDSEDDSDDETEESMGQPMREYVENVGMNWDKGSMKTPGPVGSGTGDKAGQATETNNKSVGLQNPKSRPTTTASAHNILGDTKTGAGTNTGTSPAKHMKGINPESGEKFASGIHNVDGKRSGIKTVSKQGSGYPGNNKNPGPVGSGTGDKAGQTSIGPTKSIVDKKQ